MANRPHSSFRPQAHGPNLGHAASSALCLLYIRSGEPTEEARTSLAARLQMWNLWNMELWEAPQCTSLALPAQFRFECSPKYRKIS